MKPKYGEKAWLCFINVDTVIVYKRTKDIYGDIAKDVETGVDTSHLALLRPLTKGENKKSY